jgi:8-oxo-dGTP pyrophosphatase MutT (NUDIX family)
LGNWVYNFPAGLIDPGETPEESAERELKEETGLDLVEITETMPLSYSAVGFSNESNLCLLGVAAGTFRRAVLRWRRSGRDGTQSRRCAGCWIRNSSPPGPRHIAIFGAACQSELLYFPGVIFSSFLIIDIRIFLRIALIGYFIQQGGGKAVDNTGRLASGIFLFLIKEDGFPFLQKSWNSS